MGLSGKPSPQVLDREVFESDGKKWVIAGISLRAPLKQIYTKNPPTMVEKELEGDNDSTTPTSEDARIPVRMTCPPAPRKRKSTSKCNYSGGGASVKEFFYPPDLETVFIRRHVEKAS